MLTVQYHRIDKNIRLVGEASLLPHAARAQLIARLPSAPPVGDAGRAAETQRQCL